MKRIRKGVVLLAVLHSPTLICTQTKPIDLVAGPALRELNEGHFPVGMTIATRSEEPETESMRSLVNQPAPGPFLTNL